MAMVVLRRRVNESWPEGGQQIGTGSIYARSRSDSDAIVDDVDTPEALAQILHGD